MMTLLLVSTLLVAVASAVLPAPALRQYPNKPPMRPTTSLPPNRPPPSPPGKVIAILRSVSDIATDGSSYQYGFETENGISADESGALIAGLPEPALAARGFFQFTSPEGLPIHIS